MYIGYKIVYVIYSIECVYIGYKNDVRLHSKKNWFNKNTLLLNVRRLPAISYINFIKYNECLLDKKLGSIQQ